MTHPDEYAASEHSAHRRILIARLTSPAAACWGSAVIVLVIYLLTLQYGINTGGSPYTTDVGEIQNALPRWGTLHYTGYPVYSILGSALVSLARLIGVPPAAGSSLVSALWGAAAVGLLAALALELGLPRWAALGSSLAAGLTLSFWVNSSLAEVHTMTMALNLAALLYALRYRRSGARSDLLWLGFWLSQGVAHQRVTALLVLPVAMLVWRRWRHILRHSAPLAGLALLAFAAYLYLPLRVWTGADWVFGQVGTWRGFWDMVLDTKVERGVALPQNLSEWLQRARTVLGLLHADLHLALMVLGAAGLWLQGRRRGFAVSLALSTVMLLYTAISLVVWEGYVSDALLAVKLPVALVAALGLGMLASEMAGRLPNGRYAGALLLGGLALVLGIHNAPQVLALTRDDGIETIISQVERAQVPPGGRVTALLPWGHEYWALRYAQAFRGQLDDITIVDHNANPLDYAENGYFITIPKTFYVLPVSWWEERLGDIRLDSAGPGVVRISTELSPALRMPAMEQAYDLGNGILVLNARLEMISDNERLLTVLWQDMEGISEDYAVGVHVLGISSDGAPGLVAQADSANPVGGLYPTSRWRQGEVVRDDYLLQVPPEAQPASVALFMYRQDEAGRFINTRSLELAW